MAYLAIARKWRPQKFEDLVGQHAVVQTIRNSILMDRVAHAYIFSGSRGVGKTSIARIFAKALRCENAEQGEPCNKCSECNSIVQGRSVDVVEIDGASNNGVDAVRQIRESVTYGASSGRYKVYIIDEVHMLTTSAFNALLKTLEEPPSYVVFMFATTEIQKIPLTILSRCQRFEFRRLTASEIIERLVVIAEAESFKITVSGIEIIASYSDGSLRDALSLLDQVVAHGAEASNHSQWTEADVCKALGVQGQDSVFELLKFVIDKNVVGILKVIDDLYQSGRDLKYFSERCLNELRALYLVTVARSQKIEIADRDLGFSSLHCEVLRSLSQKVDVMQVERMAQIWARCIQQLAWSTAPRFVLEMGTLRMAHLSGLENIEKDESNEPISETPKKPLLELHELVKEQVHEVPKVARDLPAIPLIAMDMEPSAKPIPQPDLSWKGFVDSVMKKRPLLGALLCHANFKMVLEEGKREVVIAFESGSFYEKQFSDAKNKTEVETYLKAYFGVDVKLSMGKALVGTTASLEKTQMQHVENTQKAVRQESVVIKAQQILGAEIVDIHVEV